LEQYLDLYKKIWPVDTGFELIRIGNDGDGGYLVPNCLEGISLCLSPGTSKIVTFENQLLTTYGIRSLLCDPGHDRPHDLNKDLYFDRLALGIEDNDGQITIESWLKKYDLLDSQPIIVTMDIEGGEYKVLEFVSDEVLSKIRILTIELHFIHMIHEPIINGALNRLLDRLLSYFDVVHMKPNNHVPFVYNNFNMYCCIELTFLSKMMRRKPPILINRNSLPHKLDANNSSTDQPPDYTVYMLAQSLI